MRGAVAFAVCALVACGRLGFDPVAGADGDGGTVIVPSCTDAIENGDELGIDCGGTCTALCPYMACSTDAQCVTGDCSGTCQLADATWRSGPSLMVARTGHACATRPDGSVYVVGGEDGVSILDSVEILAAGAAAFTAGPSLNDARSVHAVAADRDGAIYAAGGDSGGGSLASMEILTAGSNWTMGTAAPANHSSVLGAFGGDGRFYVPDISDLSIYSPADDEWTLEPGLGRDSYGIAADGARVYVVTGGGTFRVDAWDIATAMWIRRADAPFARADLAAVMAPDGRIYAIGGLDALDQPIDRVDAYTPTTNTWRTPTQMAQVRGWPCATLAEDGRVFAIGGEASTGVSATTELYGPTIVIAPARGAPGATVRVTGSGFAPDAAIAVAVDGVPVVTGTTSPAGDAELTFAIPQVGGGSHRVTAIDHRTQYPVGATLVVQ